MAELTTPPGTTVPPSIPEPPAPLPPTRDKYRWVKILLLKIAVWSFIVMVFEKVMDHIGWPGWEKFSEKSTDFAIKVGTESFSMSPLALWVNIKTEETVWINDPDHPYKEEGQTSITGNPTYNFLAHPNQVAHKVTLWEKIKAWIRNFWYQPGSDSPNWFTRILLFLVLIVAVFIKPDKGPTPPYIERAFKLLIALPFIMLAFFVVFWIIMQIMGAIAALFSWIAGLGSYAKHVVQEIKGEVVDHSKQSILVAAFPILGKLHK